MKLQPLRQPYAWQEVRCAECRQLMFKPRAKRRGNGWVHRSKAACDAGSYLRDAVADLCALVESAGGQVELFGMPVNASELRELVQGRAVARLTTGEPLNAERGPDLDALWVDLGGEG